MASSFKPPKCTAPVLSEADYSDSREFIELVLLFIEISSASAGGMLPLGCNRRRLNQSTHFRVSHSTASAVFIGLFKADDGLGQGVTVTVTDAADRRFDPGLGQRPA